MVGYGGIWCDLVGSGGIWWWDHLIPPDPGNWWDLWWHHLIPRTSPNSHLWHSSGGSLWNQRKSTVEYQQEAPAAVCGLLLRDAIILHVAEVLVAAGGSVIVGCWALAKHIPPLAKTIPLGLGDPQAGFSALRNVPRGFRKTTQPPLGSQMGWQGPGPGDPEGPAPRAPPGPEGHKKNVLTADYYVFERSDGRRHTLHTWAPSRKPRARL
jgi:hypothetical protein